MNEIYDPYNRLYKREIFNREIPIYFEKGTYDTTTNSLGLLPYPDSTDTYREIGKYLIESNCSQCHGMYEERIGKSLKDLLSEKGTDGFAKSMNNKTKEFDHDFSYITKEQALAMVNYVKGYKWLAD